MSSAYFEVTPPSGRTYSHLVEQEQQRVRVGRDITAELCIDDPLLSKVHCQLVREGDAYRLCDAGSRNGTFIAGKRLDQAGVLLSDDMVINLGLSTVRFKQGPRPASAPPLRRLSAPTAEFFDLVDAAGDKRALPVPLELTRLLVRLAEDVLPETDISRLYRVAVRLLSECLEPGRVEMFEVTGDPLTFESVARCPEDSPALMVPEHLSAAPAARSVIVSHPGTASTPALLFVPISSGGQVRAALLIEAPTCDFSELQLAMATSIGAVLGATLANARLIARLHQDKVSSTQRAREAVFAAQSRSSRGVYLLGTSPAVTKVRERLLSAAASDEPVLISGPVGTGKGAAARLIHQGSVRAERPFVQVSCTDRLASAIDNELFGAPALFDLARGGTLFIEDVEHLPVTSQERLLQQLALLPLEQRPRLIAASEHTLEQLGREKNLSLALQYLLEPMVIPMPSLRERKEDIAAISEHLLRTLARDGDPTSTLDARALAVLEQQDHPRNVRDLEQALTRAHLITPKGQPISAEAFAQKQDDAGTSERSLSAAMSRFERERILQTLKEERGHRTRTAEVLGISRQALTKKLKEYRKSSGYGEIGAEDEEP